MERSGTEKNEPGAAMRRARGLSILGISRAAGQTDLSYISEYGFLAHMTRRNAANELLKSVLDAARPIKDKVYFLYYRISDGIVELLKYATVGVKDWFKPKRPNQFQMRLRLT